MNLTIIGTEQPGQDGHESRFAAAGRPHQASHLTFIERERYFRKYHLAAEAFPQLEGLEWLTHPDGLRDS
jgi:hypothetical protein